MKLLLVTCGLFALLCMAVAHAEIQSDAQLHESNHELVGEHVLLASAGLEIPTMQLASSTPMTSQNQEPEIVTWLKYGVSGIWLFFIGFVLVTRKSRFLIHFKA